jgi:hypothetical protein
MEINNSWKRIFEKDYYQLLNPDNCVIKKGNLKTPADRGVVDNLWQRGDGFRLIFDLLLEKKDKDFEIIETGTLRNINSWSDGQSALIFTRFVNNVGGWVKSVDIDLKAVSTANSFINDPQFKCYHSDSVNWLDKLENKNSIDLFYLDSYDCKWSKDTPSAEHHLNEFKIIEPYLKDTIVAIDDNTRLLDGRRTGKGRLIYEYLLDKGITPVYDEYQVIYKF